MIFHHSDPILRETCFHKNIDDILQVRHLFIKAWQQYPEAVGIAGPQIGIVSRVFFWDSNRNTKRRKYGYPELVIDPRIIEASEEIEVANEGCLSCPGKQVALPRSKELTVEYTTESRERVTKQLQGFAARVFAHEVDHLSGKLILDYISTEATKPE